LRYEAITANAFGPFASRRLSLAPGMNVIWGVNEAGKSTWHAALYAGLCGRARGRGKQFPGKEFVDRHRPWDDNEWRVTALIRLEDGRRIEITHDLMDKSDSRALDAELARNYTNEIINEGAPDGAIWLGLDRRSFLATACVNQAEMLRVAESSKELQEHLQRAASTSGTDATAAEALGRIEEFLKESVGREQKNANKPLQRAIERLENAKNAVDRATIEHREYVVLIGQAEGLDRDERGVEAKLRVLKAAAAIQEAAECAERLDKARAIREQFPRGAPRLVSDADKLAQEASSALQAWETKPTLPENKGPSAEQIRREMEEVPQPPEGETEAAPEVESAYALFQGLGRDLRRHVEERPPEPVMPDAGGATAFELRWVADILSRPQPELSSEIASRYEEAAAQHYAALSQVKTRALVLQIIAVAMIATGLALCVSVAPKMGLVAIVLGVGVFLLAVVWKDRRRLDQFSAELTALDEQMRRNKYDSETFSTHQGEARDFTHRKGLPDEPERLRQFAEEMETAEKQKAKLDDWLATQKKLEAEFEAAAAELRGALEAHGVKAEGELEQAAQGYKDECAKRSAQAQKAGMLPGLQRQLEAQSQLEAAAEQAKHKGEEAERNLRRIAKTCGIEEDDPEVIAHTLRAWLDRLVDEKSKFEADVREWGVLTSLLQGKTLDELERESTRFRSEAAELSDGIPTEEIAAAAADPAAAESMARLQAQVNRVGTDLAVMRGQIRERERGLPSVAEAEEELSSAADDVHRIRRLKDTLEITRTFLQRAQESVHRSIAPVLSDSVRRRLDRITSGRYTDIRIDPENLEVEVRGNSAKWRRATALSHGTAEQIFLLLRVALAEHLTKPGEICPLLLDDVTVHCDSARTLAILECLHVISAERQVVLFTQEDLVVAWAEDNLDAPQDALIRLRAEEVSV
jgi:exonuclease SbcC